MPVSPALRLRLGVALAALVVGLGLAEAALRLYHGTLPSLAALQDRPDLVERYRVAPGQRMREDLACDREIADARGRDVPVGQGSRDLRLWVSGDSMAYGMGVEPGQGFADRLAARLQQSLPDTRVHLRNLSLPGLGYCGALEQVHSELQHGRPDLVLLSLFADDLESRALLAKDGRLVGLPHTIRQPALRWLARRSYAVNLAWFVMRPKPTGALRFIDAIGQEAFQRNLRALVDRVEGLGARPVVVLLNPVGAPRCDSRRATEDRCGWMLADADLMARLMDEAGLPFIDLRRLWEQVPAAPIAAEREMAVPIHPDAAGHAAIAEAVLAGL